MKPIITALCSFGMSGQVFHAPFLANHEGFDFRYVVERSKKLAQTKYSSINSLSSFEEVLSKDEVELVVINTPNEWHFPMALESLKAGKHVVIEKPFTIKSKDALTLLSLAESTNKNIYVYHNKKLEGEFKTIQQLISEKTLGTTEIFETHFDRYRPEIGPKKWKEENIPGAGILYDLGPHLIDQIFTLFGLPNELEAHMEIQRPEGKVTDYFQIKFLYPSFTAIAQAGMMEQAPFLKYKIKGSKGIYLKYGNDPQEALLKEGKSPLSENWGVEPKEQWGIVNYEDGRTEIIPTLTGTYMEFYNMVFSSIRNKTPNKSAKEAYYTIRCIELAELSNQKKEKVKFTFD